MKRLKILTLAGLLFLFTSFHATAQNRPSGVSQDEINTMNAAIKADTNLSNLLGWFGEPVDLYKKYKINLWRADSIWNHDQQMIKKLRDLGTTRHFEMIPLIDWFTSGDSLTGEAGVSYLIRTDEATIKANTGLYTGENDLSRVKPYIYSATNQNSQRSGNHRGDSQSYFLY